MVMAREWKRPAELTLAACGLNSPTDSGEAAGNHWLRSGDAILRFLCLQLEVAYSQADERGQSDQRSQEETNSRYQIKVNFSRLVPSC
jgi:hypothetical protein